MLIWVPAKKAPEQVRGRNSLDENVCMCSVGWLRVRMCVFCRVRNSGFDKNVLTGST